MIHIRLPRLSTNVLHTCGTKSNVLAVLSESQLSNYGHSCGVRHVSVCSQQAIYYYLDKQYGRDTVT